MLEHLEPRLLLHNGVVHPPGLPEWHQTEHELADASADMSAPASPEMTPFVLTAADTPGLIGEWGPVTSFSAVAVHAAIMPSGKVLYWNTSGFVRLWDPVTNVVTNTSDPTFNAFCAGHAFLADGRLLVVGGHIANGVGLPNAAIYDSTTDTWTNIPNMNAGRWYPNATTLGNGDVSVSGGTITSYSDYNTLPQVWRADGSGWRDLTTAVRAHDYYSHTYLTASGDIYYAGPNRNTFTLHPAGTGSYTEGPTRDSGSRGYGSGVMYDDGKILIAGGSDPPKASAEVIDLNAANPTWRAVDSMETARRQMTATLLADGQVLVTGGVSGAGFNNRSTAVYTAELWDPATEQFTTMASMSQPRWYHSTALLLPDGRVLTAGGDDTPNGQVFSPPYLFKGPRPTISTAPDFVTWDQTFNVSTPDAADVSHINLIRMGSVTHAFNYDQRINRLSFTKSGNTLTVKSPGQPNLAPPGYYMMFLVNGNGVPSVAKIVRVGVPTGATQAPLGGSPAAVPGVIESERFDTGGMWVSYRDTTLGNQGNAASRLSEDVDLYAAADASGGTYVGNMLAGEWLEYTVNVPAAGVYTLAARFAAGAGEGGTFHVEFDGVNKTGPRNVSASGGQWQDVTAGVTLAAGVQVVRVHIDSTSGASGLGRFDRFSLTSSVDQPPTVATPAAAAPSATTIGAPVSLSVLGADSGGEANLTYTWSAVSKPSGAANPAFGANGTNAAKQTTATFSVNGSYTLRVVIADTAGQSVSSDVVVQVSDTLTATIRAGHDSYVRGGSYANQNFGSDTALIVKRISSDPGMTRESYLRFDLASLGGNSVTDAKLRMVGTTSSSQSVPVALYGAGVTAWTEGSITWNNRPAADATVLGTATITGGGDKWYEFDVTAYLRQQQLLGAAAVTLVFKATADTNAAAILKSDEYAGAKPELVVKHAPGVPPPPPGAELVVAPTQLAVPEGSEASFTVRLSAQPADDVAVDIAVEPGADADLSTPYLPLTFTPQNWNTPQSVTVSATDDGDTINGSATFVVSSLGLSSKTVLVTETDDDVPPPPVLETLPLRAAADAYVRDGTYKANNFGTATQLIVKRSANSSNTRESYLRFNLSGVGEVDSAVLRVYGGLLSSGTGVSVQIYSASNTTWSETGLTWNNKSASGTSQLAPARSVASTSKQWYEFDVTNYLKQQKQSGATAVTFVLKAGNVTDPQAAFESDEASANHPALVVRHTPTQTLVVSPDTVAIPEGQSRTFTVRLGIKPAADVLVNITRQSGDADLSASPTSLTFTPTNWDQPQTVTIAAAEDGDSTSGPAVFAVSATGLNTVTVNATEVDNDVVGPTVLRAAADTYVRDGQYASTNYGSSTELQLKQRAIGYNRETWLRFDLASFASTSSARLRLFGRLSESMSGGVNVTVSTSSNTTWSESNLTWNNRPAAATATSPSATISGTAGTWYEWDLSNLIAAELAAGRTVLTLVLRSTTTANPHVIFASDEAASNRPELVVTP